MVDVGVDLDRKHSQVVAIDNQGEVVFERRVASSPGEVFRVFGELDPEPMEVAFEATFGWGWFADMPVVVNRFETSTARN